ncbi:hypothetical protein JFL43_20930 [Viridibacillus sp. YIM B01967]|uniref:ABC transporter permease n=1 Tax=Viridibacillus soli TaxID=2798301 RepID=A0ABS1HCV5_9BACL|nr:hypothetical protein [Viridibacillus soli]MBK3497245.1 hypothetical protein [Viridibacillus soli]
MKHKFPLTYFFVTSLYSKPKQPMLQVVLMIACFYLFLQITAVNIAVYALGNLEEFMMYNLIISNILVFALVTYLSISNVFNYHEFNMLVALPLNPERVVAAKVSSSLLVPISISIMTQFSTLIFLIATFHFVELLKLVLFLPLTNLVTALFLIYVLSLVNRFRGKIRSAIAYLTINIAIAVLLAVAVASFIGYYFQARFTPVISTMDVSDIISWKNTVILLLSEMYEATKDIPVISFVVNVFITRGHAEVFGFVIVVLLLISGLLWRLTISNISVNYLKNGVLQMNPIGLKKSKLYKGKNTFVNYLQRELWVIQSEAYFKLQIGLTLLLPPVFACILLIVIQSDWFTTDMIMPLIKYFDQYFAYSIFLISCVNNISGTPFSREGRYYNLIRTLPFSIRKIYLIKVLVASATSMLGILLSYLVYILFGNWNKESLLMMLLVLLLVLCYNLLTPIYDMKNPSIEWENPSQAIKSNPNVLVSLFYGLPIPILIVSIHFYLLFLGTTSNSSIVMLIVVMFCMLSVLVWVLKNYLQINVRYTKKREVADRDLQQ